MPSTCRTPGSFTRKNGSKIFASRCRAMPTPVSRTVIVMVRLAGVPPSAAEISIVPLFVYLIAFSTRFDTICWISLRSDRTTSAGGSTRSDVLRCLSRMRPRNGSSTSASSGATSTISDCTDRFVDRSLM